MICEKQWLCDNAQETIYPCFNTINMWESIAFEHLVFKDTKWFLWNKRTFVNRHHHKMQWITRKRKKKIEIEKNNNIEAFNTKRLTQWISIDLSHRLQAYDTLFQIIREYYFDRIEEEKYENERRKLILWSMNV